RVTSDGGREPLRHGDHAGDTVRDQDRDAVMAVLALAGIAELVSLVEPVGEHDLAVLRGPAAEAMAEGDPRTMAHDLRRQAALRLHDQGTAGSLRQVDGSGGPG